MIKFTNQKKTIHLFIITVLFVFSHIGIQAQEESASQTKKVQKPVRSPWESGYLIENQTGLVLPAKTLEFIIQHRFGNINSETFDLAGIYGASNIRIGLNYGLFKNFQLGLGTTKNKKYQDLNWKYKILTQTRSGSMPLSLTYYGNIALDAREASYFGKNYKFAHRISYFNQLIVGRKFSRTVSVQLSIDYSHYNMVDTTAFSGMKHDNFGLGFAGRVKISPQTSITLEYNQPLTTPDNIKPNLSLGVEIATSSHAFQIFVTTYSGIMPQENLSYNTNEFYKGDILLGFNITRLWGF